MDGKGRYSDNIFIERLWRTVKYEEVYLKAYSGGREAKAGIDDYFRFYNQNFGYPRLMIPSIEVIINSPPYSSSSIIVSVDALMAVPKMDPLSTISVVTTALFPPGRIVISVFLWLFL